MQYCTRNPTIKKPELIDSSSIMDINDNMDVIDGIIAKCNFNGNNDPSTADDIADGYSVGSIWINKIAHNIFIAENVSVGAAVWRKIYSTSTNVDHGSLTGLLDDDHTQYIKHSLATATNDFLVAAGNGVFVKKTLAETQSILGTGGIPPVGVLKSDGTVALTADWDAGSYEIRAQTFESDQATGTPPLVVASTTKVTNLNADKLDDLDSTAFIKHNLATAEQDFLVASGSGAFVKKTLAETKTILGVGSGGDSWSMNEVPAGTVNGTNKTFTLAHTPIDQIMLYLNGQYMTPGASDDYTLSTTTITMAVAPVSGDKIRVNYRY